MESDTLIETLLSKSEMSQETMTEFSNGLSNQLQSNQLKIIDLVEKLNPALTNGDNNIRLRGVQILTHVITLLPKDLLATKEIEVLQEFLNLRLVDHRSMEQPVLKCLLYFIDCINKPVKFNKNLLEFLKTKVNVHQMDSTSRRVVYEISKKIVVEKRNRMKTIDSDLLYSVIHMIEGENNPQNLMICFNLISYIMKNFSELEPYIDDLFEWLASYYPIDYTPKDSVESSISRANLVDALEECFFANPLNSDNLQTLLLEKLESSPAPFKIEALKSLTKCYAIYPLACVKDFASSLWTSIRMNCLKKLDSVGQDLLSASYETLSALTLRLSEDRELYMRFVIDLYEELAITFRKPEMDLFEPAARLIAHAALPRHDGFDYVLEKILPVSLNAIRANELRPISGLIYMFDRMFDNHKDIVINTDLIRSLVNIIDCLYDLLGKNQDCLRLVNCLTRNKVHFQQDFISNLREKLLATLDSSTLDVEESIAILDTSYSPSEIVEDSLKSLNSYEHDGGLRSEVEFSIYLRRIIIKLDTASPAQLSSISDELGTFLHDLRRLASSSIIKSLCIENVGRLHAIVFNKLSIEATNPLLMDLFQSHFCQNLIPTNQEDAHRSISLFVPVIKWTLKSLVLRNHQLVMPVVNLLLNFLSSNQVEGGIALTTCSQVFRFILAEDPLDLFRKEYGYQVFVLYKQKFYTQASKEIKVRIGSEIDPTKKHVMVCLLALQIPHLPLVALKNDSEWLPRELLKILQLSKTQVQGIRKCIEVELVIVIFDCMSSLIKGRASRDLRGHLGAIVDLCLYYACEASSLEIRKKALSCLTEIANSLDEKELLPLRSVVIDKLRKCLSDKKRLVRQEAAASRLRWVLVGQPIGS